MLLAELKPESIGLSELVDLSENSSEPFGPTKVFHKFYGNYCGPGNRGGAPIDDVDCACRDHDMCYHHNGRGNPECDKKFVNQLNQLTNLTFKQKTAVSLMKAYFLRVLKTKIHAPDNKVSNS